MNDLKDLASNTGINHVGLAAEIVAAYVANNPIAASEVPKLLIDVSGAIQGVATGTVEEPAIPLVPAVPVRRSVTPDYIVCLEDGKKFKSLKRHLRSFGMTPQDYRDKWGLPADYPMVAPNYAEARSELAKRMGLGQVRRQKPTKVRRGGRKPAPQTQSETAA